MWVSIGKWLLDRLLKGLSGSAIGDVIGGLAGTDDGRAKLDEVQAKIEEQKTEQVKVVAREGTKRQQIKLNQPVFWIIVSLMMGPPIIMLWSVGIYNILWWDNGIWPQSWAIADFPPGIKPWVDKSVDWLFDPIGVPSTVAAAAGASWLTGRR